jgi:hypothetical protein
MAMVVVICIAVVLVEIMYLALIVIGLSVSLHVIMPVVDPLLVFVSANISVILKTSIGYNNTFASLI